MSDDYKCSKCGKPTVVEGQTSGYAGTTDGHGGEIPFTGRKQIAKCPACGQVDVPPRK